jgi:hypothetical protein
MPLKKIIFKSGVNRENTRYTTEGGWYECDKVRFRQGTPEKIGGWYQISNATFIGVCRALWNWVTLNALNVLAVGTNVKYYLENGDVYYDITPLRYTAASTTLTNPFAVTNTLNTVVVTWAGSDLSTGDVVNISGVTVATGGIPAVDFNKQFTVTRIGTNTFQITVASVASSTATGGGTVSITSYKYTQRLTNPFNMTASSSTITVNATAHGCRTGDYAIFTSTTTTNGVTINGSYVVFKIDDNTYTITASTNATAT